jgi:prepilin-type processing-associated H-X9-DG protein
LRGEIGHQDGYNCLYADGSGRWFGDPQKKVIYWAAGWGAHVVSGGDPIPEDETCPYTGGVAAWQGVGDPTAAFIHPTECFVDLPYCNGPNNANNPYVTRGHSNLALWHQFDVINGIDADASRYPWGN